MSLQVYPFSVLHAHKAANMRSRPDYLCNAIALSPLLFLPGPISMSPYTNHRQAPSPTHQSALAALPLEVLIMILNKLTMTSRVNLAVTSKTFAELLNRLPGILTFRTSTPGMLQLLMEDESLQCWSIDTSKFLWKSCRQGARRIRRVESYWHFLRYKCCGMSIRYPTPAKTDLRTPYTEDLTSHLRDCREYDNILYQHTQEYVCRSGGGRMFTRGMLTALTVYVDERIREQNTKWMKAAIVSWAMALNARTG